MNSRKIDSRSLSRSRGIGMTKIQIYVFSNSSLFQVCNYDTMYECHFFLIHKALKLECCKSKKT